MNNYICSFCKNSLDKEIILTKDGTAICYSCVNICHSSIKSVNFNLKRPNALTAYENVKKIVIGQDDALKTITSAFCMHVDRIRYNNKHVSKILKSNLLVVGPTGTGKTLTIETMSKQFNVPFTAIDATSITEKGYVGEDPEVGFVMLLKKTKYNVEQAQNGVIYVDEIDKIARRGSINLVRDISGEGVQQSMLKMMDGTEIIISEQKRGGIKNIIFNASNVMFVLSGAFPNIGDITHKRLKGNAVGLVPKQTEAKNIHQTLPTHEDITEYGFINEFVGRIGLITCFQKLSKEMISNILDNEYSYFSQMKKLMSFRGVEVKITDEAKLKIVEIAHGSEFGVRKIKSVIDSIFSSIYFITQSNKTEEFLIEKDHVIKFIGS